MPLYLCFAMPKDWTFAKLHKQILETFFRGSLLARAQPTRFQFEGLCQLEPLLEVQESEHQLPPKYEVKQVTRLDGQNEDGFRYRD